MPRGITVGVLTAVGALIAALALAASQASAAIVYEPNGHFLSVMPHRGLSATQIPGSVAAQHASALATGPGTVDYHGGPVLHSSDPYLIFWDPGNKIGSSTESLLEQYFTDVAADSGGSGPLTNVFGVDEQYTDSSGPASYSQTFSSTSQAIVDTQAYPATNKTSCPDTIASTGDACLTDGQLQTEVKRLISADGLPTGTGANAPIYFVVLPTDVNECADASDCADNTFCAYHSNRTSPDALYAAIPLIGAALPSGSPYANGKDCQFDGYDNVQDPNGNQVADIATTYMSHEDNETITDPLGTAWWNTSSGNEIGDNCVFEGSFDPVKGDNPDAFAPTVGGSASAGTLYDQVINSHDYYTQSEWSNGNNDCELRPTITPSFAAPAGPNAVGSSLTFDPSASVSTLPITSETWSFGDGSAPVSGSSLGSASHTYSTAGKYTVTLQLGDGHETSSTTGSITVYSRPVASFTYSPGSPSTGTQVSFDGSGSSDPDSGVKISSYSWNFGDGSSGSGQTATATHTYTAAGTYTISLTVTNSAKLTATTTRQITVAQSQATTTSTGTTSASGGAKPAAAFSIATRKPGTGQGVAFDARSSSDPGGSLVSYTWSFGDGATGTGVRASHAFKKAGTYTVTLAVVDSSGVMAIVSHTVTIAKAAITALVITHKTTHGATVLVSTNAPGTVTAGRRSFRLHNAGTAKLSLRLSRSQRLKVRFVPTSGSPSSRTITIRL